jgi:preprotein translocase subunit SecF
MSPVDRHDEELTDLIIPGSSGAEAIEPEALEEEAYESDDELADDEAIKEATDSSKHHKPKSSVGAVSRLYRGGTTYDFVGRRKVWFTISTAVIVIGILSIILRGGLNLGIDFKGGTSWQTTTAAGLTQPQAVSVVTAAGLKDPTVEILGQGKNAKILVESDLNSLSPAIQQSTTTKVTEALVKATHADSVNDISVTHVGPTWGGEITSKAITALIVFFIVVGLYISFRFEPKMAVAAFVAMLHDILVTIGVYSIFNFQVTPDTVVAVLTILGYSLYDTVVVFDRVRDNTKGIGSTGRMTYSQMVNLSMNQTLARSINTSLVAILPVLSILVIGAVILGATTLQNYGVALFVGLLSGAYSSIFIASPVLAMMKEREPRWIQIRQRLESRGDRTGTLSPAAAALLTASSAGSAATKGRTGAKAQRSGTVRPGSASQARAKSGGGASKSATTGTSGGGAATATATATRPTSGATKKAPPRPRKGGGKSKSKKRR